VQQKDVGQQGPSSIRTREWEELVPKSPGHVEENHTAALLAFQKKKY
jgi:hypothetical protein